MNRHARVHGRFARRLTGFAIDLAIVVTVVTVVGRGLSAISTAVVYLMQFSDIGTPGDGFWIFAVTPWLGAFVALGLIVYCGRSLGGSPGHVAVGLAIYDWRSAHPARAGQLLARAVLLFGPAIVALNATFLPLGLGESEASPDAAVLLLSALPALVLLWYPVLAYGALVRPSGRALHDRITGTVVDVAGVDDNDGDGPDDAANRDGAAR